MRVPTGCVCRMSKKHSLTLTVSLADQQFARAKSVGIFNLATGLARRLAGRADLAALAVLGNRTLEAAQFLPQVNLPNTMSRSPGGWRGGGGISGEFTPPPSASDMSGCCCRRASRRSRADRR